MFDHVLGRDAECGIVHERLHEKIHSSGVDVLDLRGEIVLVPARESGFVVGQRGHAGPNLLSWCAEDAEHAEELIDLRVALEQRLARCHFGKDAAD